MRDRAIQLDDETRRLANNYWPLAVNIARIYGRRFPWLRDEFLSEAGEVLCRSVHSFDPGRKIKLPTYIGLCIERAFRAVVRRDGPRGYRGKATRMDAPRVESLSHLPDFDPIDPASSVEQTEIAAETFAISFARVDDRDADLLRRLYVDDVSCAAVARERCVSKSAVSHAHRRILRDLRKASRTSS